MNQNRHTNVAKCFVGCSCILIIRSILHPVCFNTTSLLVIFCCKFSSLFLTFRFSSFVVLKNFRMYEKEVNLKVNSNSTSFNYALVSKWHWTLQLVAEAFAYLISVWRCCLFSFHEVSHLLDESRSHCLNWKDLDAFVF